MNTNHYPSLENCKKLKEIGFPDTAHTAMQIHTDLDNTQENAWMPCPSVMEMLDEIKTHIIIGGPQHPHYLTLNIECFLGYKIKYNHTMPKHLIHLSEPIFSLEIKNKSLPNALAEMAIWLVENKYLSFNKDNLYPYIPSGKYTTRPGKF